MSRPAHHATPPLVLLSLFGALLVTGCGDAAGDDPDARVDATLDASSLADGGHADAGDAAPVADYDAGPLPCEAPGYFSPHAVRISQLLLSERGRIGYGLNMDGLPTCSPPWGGGWPCNGGVDNQLGSLSVGGCFAEAIDVELFNEHVLIGLIEEGNPPANFILEARGLTMDATDSVAPFSVVLHTGHWFDSTDCPEPTSVLDPGLRCDYLVDDEMMHAGTCDPISVLDNAEIVDGQLTAGGDANNLWFTYNAQGLSAGLVMHAARVEADVVVDGTAITITNGVIGGAICPNELAGLIVAVTTSAGLGACTPDNLPPPDLEIGCSADTPDAISMGFTFAAHPAHIVGLWRE